MKTTCKQNLLAVALVGALAMSGLATQAVAQNTRFDELANLPFSENRPTQETAQTLRDELLNWLATVPGKGYFAILRLYGPTEAAINKSWKPGDIEKVK